MEWIWTVRRHWWTLPSVLTSWFWITIPSLELGIKDVRDSQIILKNTTILEHPSNMLSDNKKMTKVHHSLKQVALFEALKPQSRFSVFNRPSLGGKGKVGWCVQCK